MLLSGGKCTISLGRTCRLARSNRAAPFRSRTRLQSSVRSRTSISRDMSDSFSKFLRTKPRIILGSSSPWRQSVIKELAETHEFAYTTAAANIDERAIRFSCAQELVLAIGRAKANKIAEDLKTNEGDDFDGFLVTGDQVVVCNGKILEKPDDEAQAREFISGYAEHPSQTVGSIICTHLPSQTTSEWVEKTEIHIDPIPQDSIDMLIEEGAVFLSAGGLMIEHPLVSPHITKIVGGEDAVRGMSKVGLITTLIECWEKQLLED
ncbi:hypothetical protein BSKO_11458 [Bryopsis sp. KO-2023]|nr:hypothetical protein BSKO_11458 [Bryopsis sp. KO-2023]